MSENTGKINQLQDKLEILVKKQASFQKELDDLHTEIQDLKITGIPDQTNREIPQITTELYFNGTEINQESSVMESQPVVERTLNNFQPKPIMEDAQPSYSIQNALDGEQTVYTGTPDKPPKIKSDIEKFIGENLINKIGIAITIIGVGIGAKYAIDHDLISPWTRIILGYLVGLGLLGFAIYLKKQFENFSAVLFSGSMAIMYFMTFAAYTFYELIPLLISFILMVMFTVVTVAAAIIYNRQVVAHIGLVGAYAVPFLLGNESGSVVVLYSYMAIINAGILVISFRKYWKSIFYSSFILTWLIFLTWYIPKYQAEEHFALALTFITIFFATFYLIFLAYKLIKKEKFEIEEILLLLANSTVYYGLGYAILNSHQSGEDFLGIFTALNAAIHASVSIVIFRQKSADRNLLNFVTGMALVFLTIAIPVQLDGHWVTLLWSGEVALLFWIGRARTASIYELLSYPLMFLVLISLVHDWLTVYDGYNPAYPASRIIPLFNVNFLTSVFFIASFALINFLNRQEKYVSSVAVNRTIRGIMNFAMIAILLIGVYFSLVMEISTFWNQIYVDSMGTVDKDLTVPQHFWNEDISKYSTISMICYSLLFLTVLSYVNILKIKNFVLGLVNLTFNVVALGLALTIGLYALGELRDSYLSQTMSEFYYRGGLNIGIRYILFVFTGGMLVSMRTYVLQQFISLDLKKEFDLLLHITLLTIMANELINWMDLFGSEQSYKLGLSILCGVYALLLIALGIWKKKKHLRIAAIVVFAATLIKLFAYDLAYLNTISKTIVFIVLGILLLIISFLYNKYKNLIFDHD